MSRLLRVALVQEAPVFLNLSATVDRAVTTLRDVAQNGAELAVFPETWLPGYPVWLDLAPRAAMWDEPGAKALFRVLTNNSLELDSPEDHRLAEASRDCGIFMVMGAHERRGGTMYNTILTYGPNGEKNVHRKLIPTYSERLVWGQGDGSTLRTLQTPFGALGGLVCWEHWMPLARAAMHAQNESVHVAQWPAVGDMHQVASRQYAFEGGCFVLASGCVMSKRDILEGAPPEEPLVHEMLASMEGEPEDLLRNGGSAVIGPDGKYVVEPVFDSPETIYADIDLAAIDEARMKIDTSGHYSRPDVFHLTVDTSPRTNVTFT